MAPVVRETNAADLSLFNSWGFLIFSLYKLPAGLLITSAVFNTELLINVDSIDSDRHMKFFGGL